MTYENPVTGATVDASVLRDKGLQRTETSPRAPAPTTPLLERPAGSDSTYTRVASPAGTGQGVRLCR